VNLEGVPIVGILWKEAVRGEENHPAPSDRLHGVKERGSVFLGEMLDDVKAGDDIECARPEQVRQSLHISPDVAAVPGRRPPVLVHLGRDHVDADRSRDAFKNTCERSNSAAADIEEALAFRWHQTFKEARILRLELSELTSVRLEDARQTHA
jgi:hypothetical protein